MNRCQRCGKEAEANGGVCDECDKELMAMDSDSYWAEVTGYGNGQGW